MSLGTGIAVASVCGLIAVACVVSQSATPLAFAGFVLVALVAILAL